MPTSEPATIGRWSLWARAGFLVLLPWIHDAGVGVISALLLLAGGWIPLFRRWLHDTELEVGGAVRLMGGVRPRAGRRSRSAELGLILRRGEAPLLHDMVRDMARRLGVLPPEEIRIACLPCCGVLAVGNKRVVLVGLPLLPILTRGELQAVLAHEMTHLARGDATRVMDALRFLNALGAALDELESTAWGPLRAWSRMCRRIGESVAQPVARGQEIRADRVSASIAGGLVSASALSKVAIVQPLFREVLGRHRPDAPQASNVFATFRSLWDRLPAPLLEQMRSGLLIDRTQPTSDPHPPLAVRLALLRRYPDRAETETSQQPASSLVNDLEWLEDASQTALFSLETSRPSVFHRAGS